MKTLRKNSLMMSRVRLGSLIRNFVFVSAIAGIAAPSFAQDSWSDSAPRIMKLVKTCPMKVRDKNGEWANFKDTLPAGRNVVGAINPRRPDLVFFQLSRDSNFMFAAARSCFEGEETWNVAAEEEKNGGTNPAMLHDRHSYFLGDITRLSQKAEGSTDTSGTSASTYTYSLGFGAEQRSDRWYFGGLGSIGYGHVKMKVSDGSISVDDSVPLYTFSLRGSAYYDFISLPYALGFEPFVEYSKLKAVRSADTSSSSEISSGGFKYGISAGWRFYWDQVTITPKLVTYLNPTTLGIGLQVAYLLGPR
ncbi:MAG: autotransporter domain-containing protein [Bdellovibrionota bacterium]